MGIKPRTFTIYFTIAAVIVIFAVDGYMMMMHGQESTISDVIINVAYEQPSIVFLSGFVCGHLFWRMKKKKDK